MTSRKQRPSSPDPVEARTLLLQAIAASDAPVSLAFLGSLAGLGHRLPGTQVRKLLADDLASGSVFQWGTAARPMLWQRDPKTVARERILEFSSLGILTRSALNKRVAEVEPRVPAKAVPTVLTLLVREKRLREVPAAPGLKTRILINAERPQLYLESAIANLLDSFGLTRPVEKIRNLLQAEGPEPAPEAAPEGGGDIVRDVAERIFMAMNRIAFSPGATVTFYRLRQQPELAAIPKGILDRAALLLQSERRALLSVHDHAAALPEEEREGFVTDGLGKFYVSIYAR